MTDVEHKRAKRRRCCQRHVVGATRAYEPALGASSHGA